MKPIFKHEYVIMDLGFLWKVYLDQNHYVVFMNHYVDFMNLNLLFRLPNKSLHVHGYYGITYKSKKSSNHILMTFS